MPHSPNSHRSTITRSVRAGIASDEHHGAVVPPLHLSTNFSFAGFDQKRRYDYTRSGNPTRDQLADALAGLEEGAGAVVTSSGMSAVSLALQLAPAGGKVLAAHDCYGGTYRLLRALAARNQIQLELADLTAPDAERAIARFEPDLLWIETPSNPLLRITDLRTVCAAGHRVGALVVADNTFLSPALQRPLTLGADLVVHSTTKYLNGHSDVVGGAVVARDPAHVELLTWWANCLGLTGAPFDSARCSRACAFTRPTRSRSRRRWMRIPRYSRFTTPGCHRIPVTRWRRASRTGLAGWSRSPWPEVAPPRRPWPRRWSASRWRSRWVAWRALWRTRPP